MHKQFDLWCISILTKKKTFSANDFLSEVQLLSTKKRPKSCEPSL